MKNIDIVSLLKAYDNNGYKYIYIYYKTEGKAIRINTKCRWIKNKMTKENYYNFRMKNYENLNRKIELLKHKVDSYIVDQMVSGAPNINQKGCQRYIKNYEKIISEKMPHRKHLMYSDGRPLLGFYKNFLEEKKANAFIKPISVKNYISFKNFLVDFEKNSSKSYVLDDIDESLINKMVRFSQISLKKEEGYITKGLLQQNTLKKRLDVFKEFLTWLTDKEIKSFNTHKLFPKLEKTNKEIIYISKEEIKSLISKRDKVEGQYNKVVFDSFIFNCECGLRFQDLASLTKSDFIKMQNGYILKKELNKHSIKFSSECQIPIVDPLLINIIESHDFQFNIKSNQEYNRTLHKVLKHHELLMDKISTKRKYINGKTLTVDVPKNEIITCHSCRRTMITNAFIEGFNNAQVMQMSGHKDLKMLKKYSNFTNQEILNKNIEKKISVIMEGKNK